MFKEFFAILILGIMTAFLFFFLFSQLPMNTIVPFNLISHNFTNSSIYQLTNTTINTTANLSYPSPTPIKNYTPSNKTIAYVLAIINNDRKKYNLTNVSLSNITSAQQHANNMLQYDYFSHWDIYGMKPYMRYTLLNGKGAVQENVAYMYQSDGINVTSAIKKMEYNMMYNDYTCCDNGHRYNILNPQHNQVSIGVAFNYTTVYFVEDFINNYIDWFYNTPNITNSDVVNLKGEILNKNMQIDNIEISYDAPVHNMTKAELANTTSYSYGNIVAGVGYSQGGHIFYFSNIMTLNASTYLIDNNKFDISFNMLPLIKKEGAGEYTIMVWMNSTTNSSSFIGSTYTFFINNTASAYMPKNV
ncbi:MAG: CAP domain-containing protein [Candidatus Marsarchaeota archaeon]|nr:CAP domain-containing protein [Candidatus Marsarchaeota archaeon]